MLTEFLIKQSQNLVVLLVESSQKIWSFYFKNLVFGRLNRLLFQIIIEFLEIGYGGGSTIKEPSCFK